MDNILQVSSTIIRKDDDNLVVWLHFARDTRGFADQDKSPYRRLINQEIRAIWDAQVPREDERFFLANPRPTPSMRVFVEKDNDLSEIVWLAWEPRTR